jgi:hypothetical protein
MSEPPILLSKNRRSTVVSRRQVSLRRSGLQKARSALLKFAHLFALLDRSRNASTWCRTAFASPA